MSSIEKKNKTKNTKNHLDGVWKVLIRAVSILEDCTRQLKDQITRLKAEKKNRIEETQWKGVRHITRPRPGVYVCVAGHLYVYKQTIKHVDKLLCFGN